MKSLILSVLIFFGINVGEVQPIELEPEGIETIIVEEIEVEEIITETITFENSAVYWD